MSITIGLDLGQAADFSALAILERTLHKVTVTRAGKAPRQEMQARYGARALKRWALGTSYPAIVKEVTNLVSKLDPVGTSLVIDATGVGRPVVDMFRQAWLSVPLVPVVITSGNGENYQDDGIYRVAKVVLISTLQVLLQQRRLKFSQSLPLVPVLVKELQNYRVKITPALNETFSAREGDHDDLLLALALAAWNAERMPLPGTADVIAIDTDAEEDESANPFRRHKNRYCGVLRRRR